MGGFGAGDEKGVIGRKLWIKSRNKWVLAVYTPFILCLDFGKLDSHSFLHCVSWHLLLQASLKAYEMAEECADDDDDKSAICKLSGGGWWRPFSP